MANLQEIEQRRAQRKAELEEARAKQKAIDLEALDSLETEHGDDRVVVIEATAWRPGLPTFAVYRLPTAPEMKRWQDMAKQRKDGTPGDSVGAANQLAASCREYPPAELYAEMLDACALNHTSAGTELAVKASGKKVEEGKG